MSPKVLVANRGEIAIRILQSAYELGWGTVAIYTEGDSSHATFADEAVKLDSSSDFVNVKVIVDIATRTQCTHLHPGYGFLSENPALPLAVEQAHASVVFIGPPPSTLRIASDKMLTRELASSLGVRVAPGTRVASEDDILAFASAEGPGQGYPVMIKALDGGGGRGIRIAEGQSGVREAFKRCLGESPSRQVFVEKALTGPGWKHIEVQVIGDGRMVNHLWERECSVQRRFQKIGETAPSRLPRSAIQPLIDASLKMARHLQYKGLGTFEFLLNSKTFEWVFLEINPRIQVEHTITEEITNVDLVRSQLLLFSPGNSTLSVLSLDSPPTLPSAFAIQLRLTAEDPQRNFQLSPGSLSASDVSWPSGRGIRVDTWLTIGHDHPDYDIVEWTVGTDFDSLLAKIIVRGASFLEATQKGLSALRQIRPGAKGKVKTNIPVLAGILSHPDWVNGAIDTLWLERKLGEIINRGDEILKRTQNLSLGGLQRPKDSLIDAAQAGRNNIILQPGSLFHLTLSPPSNSVSSLPQSSDGRNDQQTRKHTVTLTSIAQNAFPDVLSGTISSSFPSPFPSSSSSTSISFTLSRSTSATVSTGSVELADPNDPRHVATPMTGKIVEIHPALAALQFSSSGSVRGTDLNDVRRVRQGDPLVVLSVMKMENAISAPYDGFVERIGTGLQAGAILVEGSLICVLEKQPSRRLTSHL